MARKQPSTNAEPPQAQEKAPVITPEIEDGYAGIVKRLFCSICQHVFYMTDADYQTMPPSVCHDCSMKAFREYEEKQRQELTARERKRHGSTKPEMTEEEFHERMKEILCRLALQLNHIRAEQETACTEQENQDDRR
jgi:hypothetical protein